MREGIRVLISRVSVRYLYPCILVGTDEQIALLAIAIYTIVGHDVSVLSTIRYFDEAYQCIWECSPRFNYSLATVDNSLGQNFDDQPGV